MNQTLSVSANYSVWGSK